MAGRSFRGLAGAIVAALVIMFGRASAAQAQPLVIGTQFDYFQVNGAPKFLVFFSYFDALRASDATLDSDFGAFQSKGINGVRIFANWWDHGIGTHYASDTLMDSSGALRADRLARLKTILTKAKTYGLMVDVTFSCETVSGLTFAGYSSGITSVTNELAGDAYRHVFFDLQNESTHISCAGLGTPTRDDERWALKDAVKNADPMRLITASMEQVDGTPATTTTNKSSLVNLDIIAYHDPRVSNWYDLSDDVVNAFRTARNCGAYLAATANTPGFTPCKPLYLQEPSDEVPTGQNYIDAVKNAKSAGGAAWTFHTHAAFDLQAGTAMSQVTTDQLFFMNNFLGQLNTIAWEGDGVLDTWRTFFGVTGAPGDDQDGDGLSNLAEFQGGTHPNGATGLTRYFVEGRNDTFYGTRLALVNPSSSTTASVLVRFSKDDGSTVSVTRSLAPLTRQTIDTTRVAGLREMGFATRMETTARVVADRTMWWDRTSAYGAHAERNIIAPSTAWYMADGTTSGAFDLKYVLWNPNAFALTIQVRYLLPSPAAPVTRNVTLNANQRFEYFVDTDPALTGTDVAAQLTAAAPFLAERVQYYTSEGRTYNAGNASAPMNGLATSVFFAEGSTGSFFDTYLLLANPNATASIVQATYVPTGGASVVRTYTVPANSRMTIRVDDDPALANTSFWVRLDATNAVPFVAERTMWWPDGIWRESHSSVGETATWPNWALAEGETGFSSSEAMYVLVANTSAFADTVRLTLLFDGGGTATKDFAIPALGRLSIDIAAEFPSAANQRFGVLAQGLTGSQLVVERSIYWNANGLTWAVGTNAFGTRF